MSMAMEFNLQLWACRMPLRRQWRVRSRMVTMIHCSIYRSRITMRSISPWGWSVTSAYGHMIHQAMDSVVTRSMRSLTEDQCQRVTLNFLISSKDSWGSRGTILQDFRPNTVVNFICLAVHPWTTPTGLNMLEILN